jgi:Na+/proline symporter
MTQLGEPGIAEAFRWIKEPGAFPSDRYTWDWAIVIFAMQLIGQVQLTSASRYLSAKDGREASRAAWLAFLLMAVGSAVWFLPPMVARFLYAPEVLGMNIKDPATAAYAVAARNLLPNGLMGVLIAAMFAATMSSMDTGLNGQTSIVVRNLIPRIREGMKLPPLGERTQLGLCRGISLGLGILIIVASLLLARQTRFILFDAFLTLSSVIGAPLGLPLLAGILFRRLPGWSFFFIFAASLVPSVVSLVHETTGGEPWTVQARGGWVLLFGLGAMAISWLCRNLTSHGHREREASFFRQMQTPVDFATEVGESRDHVQALMLGRSVTAMGALLLLFLLVPNTMAARGQILAMAALVIGLGSVLWFHGHRGQARTGDRASMS